MVRSETDHSARRDPLVEMRSLPLLAILIDDYSLRIDSILLFTASSSGVMTSQTVEEQVHAFTHNPHLSIAKPLQKYAQASRVIDLPRHASLHWRGLWQPNLGHVHGRFRPFDELLPAVPVNSRRTEFTTSEAAVLCHCKPFDDRKQPVENESLYPDIPDRLDLYFLLRHQFDAIAFVGKTLAAIIRRTDETYPTILRLRDWEADRNGGRYRRVRGRSQLRRTLGREPTNLQIERQHAISALRAIGLCWPGNPKLRHKQWVECLSMIGLSAEISKDLGPTQHRAISTEMQQELHWSRTHR